jgi:hypothetical protein
MGLLSLEVSAAETSGLSSSGDFSSVISQLRSLVCCPPGRGRIDEIHQSCRAFQSLAIVLDLTAA